MKSKLLKDFLSIGILSTDAFPLSFSAKEGKTVPKCRTIVLTDEDAYLATQVLIVWLFLWNVKNKADWFPVSDLRLETVFFVKNLSLKIDGSKAGLRYTE